MSTLRSPPTLRSPSTLRSPPTPTHRDEALRPVLDALRSLRFVHATRLIPAAMADDSLLRNSLAIMATTLLTSGLGYIFWVVAAHSYTTRDVGVASALISTVTVISIVGSLGLGSGLVERLPACQTDQEWAQTINAALVTATLAGALTAAVAAWMLPLFASGFAGLRSTAMAAMFVVGAAAWTAAVPLDYVFVAERATGGMVVRNTVGSVVKIPFMVAALMVGLSTTTGLFASWTLAAVLALVLGVFVLVPRLRSSYRFQCRGTASRLRSMTHSLIGHHLTTVGSILPTWLLPVIVVVRLSAQANAYFFLTWMVGGLFFMVSPSVAASLFAEGSHDRISVRRRARRSAAIIGALLAGPMVVFVVGGKLILRVFGSTYPARGYGLLVLLVIAAIPDAVTNVAVAVMRVEGHLRRSAVLNLSMSVLALVLAWFLLPPMGIAGAGLAWLIAQSVGSGYVLADVVARARRQRHRPVVAPV